MFGALLRAARRLVVRGLPLAAAVATATGTPAYAESDAAAPGAPTPARGTPLQPEPVRLVAEAGYLAVLSHHIQFGRSGSDIDYRSDGGQDVLFPFLRFGAEIAPSARHRVVLLYQPLALESRALHSRDLVVDDLTFPAGTATIFRYGFPFWRGSYLYDFDTDPRDELALGLSLQVRDATIEFESIDGTRFRSNRDVGPVPILKARWRQGVSGNWWLGAEIDGFYAPISYLNGSDEEVVGAIADASVRGGLRLEGGTELFVNVRYLGGGAKGSSERAPTEPGDGYVRNWIHFLTVTLGLGFAGSSFPALR